MSTIAATSQISSNYAASDPTRLPTQTLGQDDFLKLLVAQLSTQDPLNPTKDSDFIAQMAQFSSLEQTKTMGGQLGSLRLEQEFLQGNQLIGRTVELEDGGSPVSGVVSAMRIEAGTPKIEVNGHLYDLTQVRSVAVPTTNG